MDKTDERVLDLLKGNARLTYQEIGDAIGMTRVAAKKRVKKLEEAGIIRGYNTTIYRDDEVTVFIDIETEDGSMDKVLDYLGKHTAYIRQIFTTTKENHIHVVAVSDSVSNLKYLTTMIQKRCGKDIVHITCHAVKEIIKDVYGGVKYERRKQSESDL